MSTLAKMEWPEPPVVGTKTVAAAQKLRGCVRAEYRAKSGRELKALGENVPGARWRNFMRLHVFERIDWGDGTAPSLSTRASFYGGDDAIDDAMVLMTCLRAVEQADGARVKMAKRFRLVVELEHVETSTVCWIDAETGEVIAGEVWRKTEERRLAKAQGERSAA